MSGSVRSKLYSIHLLLILGISYAYPLTYFHRALIRVNYYISLKLTRKYWVIELVLIRFKIPCFKLSLDAYKSLNL